MNQVKKIPQFKTEAEEQKFWANNSAVDYMDSFEPATLDLSDLKPSTKTISLRLPESMIEQLKSLQTREMCPTNLS